MKDLAHLKQRLEDLPDRRKAKEHEGNYAQFLVKANAARDRLTQVAIGIPLADSVLPSPDYKEARKKLNTAARSSKMIADKLKKDPALISEAATDRSFVTIDDNTSASLITIKKAWETQLQNRIKDFEVIAGVILKIALSDGGSTIKAQSKRLTGAIDSLRDSKNQLPQSKEHALRVKTDIDILLDAVAKLDLNTPFGKFLQATASAEGVDLDLLENTDVSQAIEKHKLQKVFRVRIS